MSRIGNSPITIPEGVSVEIQPNLFIVKGKLGELSQSYELVSIEQSENTLTVKRVNESKTAKAKHGLYRSLFNNMVQGVSNGWSKELELVGVGYRANNQGQKLELALGFSHNIVFQIPAEVKVETVSEKGKNPIIKLTSLDKQLVGAIASKIRSFRKPEPYKGKGVKYVGEEIRRKAGKSA
jgi:large subunit ribosomal protein L6